MVNIKIIVFQKYSLNTLNVRINIQFVVTFFCNQCYPTNTVCTAWSISSNFTLVKMVRLLLASQMVCERSEVFASACAISRAFPLFTRRSASSRRTEKKRVAVEFVSVGQDNGPLEVSTLEVKCSDLLPHAIDHQVGYLTISSSHCY